MSVAQNPPQLIPTGVTAEPQRAIVLVFDDKGNVSMQATPEVTASDFIVGAFNLTRHANRVLDGTGSKLAMPGRKQ